MQVVTTNCSLLRYDGDEFIERVTGESATERCLHRVTRTKKNQYDERK